MTKYIFLIIIFFGKTSLANLLFQVPHETLKHPYKGCPEDSICTQEVGQFFEAWMQKWRKKKSLRKKNSFVDKSGFPFYFYTRPIKESPLKQTVYWHSKCDHHKKQGVYKALSFFKELNPSERSFFQPLAIWDQGRVVQFELPLGFTPISYEKNELTGIYEWEAEFLPLLITSESKFKFKAPLSKTLLNKVTESERVACPKELKPLEKYRGYFLDSYCKTIHSDSSKPPVIALYYWSCP